MLQTLYKIATPMGGPPINSEFYSLSIRPEVINGKTAFFVKEKHGWWDEDQKRPLHLVQTLGPEEGFSTFDEALDMYETHVQHRVSNGFIHSFSLDYYSSDRLR